MDKIKSSKVERIVFDEAHIITTWGTLSVQFTKQYVNNSVNYEVTT